MNTIDLAITAAGEINPTVEEGVDYYLRNQTITITPTYTLPLGDSLSDYELRYVVATPSNIEIVNIDTTLDGTCEFDITSLGAYQVFAMALNLNTGVVSSVSMEVNSVNPVVIAYTDCNNFSITNNTGVTVTYTIVEVNNNATLSEPLVEDVDIFNAASATFQADNAGVFLVYVVYTPVLTGVETEEIYMINNLCSVNDCLSAYILDTLCEDTRDCKECGSELELNQLLLLYYTLNMKLNQEYGTQNFYTNLEQSDLDNFASITTLIERITKFCNRRNCNTANSTSTTYNWNNTGCTSCNG